LFPSEAALASSKEEEKMELADEEKEAMRGEKTWEWK
jgi:hypothetical protein